MALDLASRQGVIATLIFLEGVIIVIEFVFFHTKQDHGSSRRNKRLWYRFIYPRENDWPLPTSLTDVRQSLAPLVFAIVGTTLISITFWNANGIHNKGDEKCSTNIDADISGVGVRVAIWFQIGTLILISTFGFFHQESTGIKEVGGGLILTHVALAIALAVRIHTGTLTSVDAAIGAAILDAQNLALQIPATAKETLAARWQVILLIPTQILGLVTLPVLVVGLTNGTFASEDCKCLCIFWWSRLSNCALSSRKELSVFWIYYSLRWIMWAQSCLHSMYNAEWFHQSEQSKRNTTSDSGEVIDSTEAPVLFASIEAGFLYTEYPATISMSYMIYTLFSLTSMVVAEVSIRDWKLQPSSDVGSVGQVVAIVVAVASFFRAVWSFQSLFNAKTKHKSFPDLIFTLFWDRRGDRPSPSKRNVEEQMTGRERNRSAPRYGTHDPRNLSSTQLPAAHFPTRCPPSNRYGQGLEETSALLDTGDTASTSDVSVESQDVTDQQRSDSAARQQEHDLLQTNSYGPRYRFEFRQPFHLEFIKQFYFPTLTRYLRRRHEGDVAPDPIDMDTTSQAGDSVVIDQPTDSQASKELLPESYRPGAPLVLRMDRSLGSSSVLSFSRRSSASSGSGSTSPERNAPAVSGGYPWRRRGRITPQSSSGISVNISLGGASTWYIPRKSYDVGSHFTLGRLSMRRIDFEKSALRDRLPPIPVHDQFQETDDHMNDTVYRILTTDADMLLKEMAPGSVLHSAALQNQAHPERNGTSDVVKALHIVVNGFVPSKADVTATLQMLHPEEIRRCLLFGRHLYIITGVAMAINLATIEAPSREPPTSESRQADAEASDGKGKGAQSPSDPTEVFAYQVRKIRSGRDYARYLTLL